LVEVNSVCQASLQFIKQTAHQKGIKLSAEYDPVVKTVRADEHRLKQIFLMDIQMPYMDGLEAIKIIRADTSLDTIPIIALTALAMNSDRERYLAAGANEYLSKPLSLKKLVHLVDKHVQNAR
jgi:CheY-like chemotaxis protein